MAPYAESLYTLACLFDNVYHLHDVSDPNDIPQTVVDALNARVNYRVIAESIRKTEGLCAMAVWQHVSKPLRILVIKGTSLDSPSDIINDLGLVVGREAADIVFPTLDGARKLIAKFGVQMVTGHSLGGYVAEILATNDGLDGASFCNPGVNDPFDHFGGSPRPGFHNINMEHDPFGNFMSGAYQHVQWSVYVGLPPCHSIVHMVSYFQEQQYIDNVNVYSHCESWPTGYYYPK